MMSEYFYREHGRVVGPLSWENIEVLCRRRTIGETTEIRNNDGPWNRVCDYPSLLKHYPVEPRRDRRRKEDAPHREKGSDFSLDDLIGPKKPQHLSMCHLMEEASSPQRLKEKAAQRRDEEGTSYWSIGIIVIVGIAAHGAIVWNYSNIFQFFRDLFGLK